MYIYIYIYISLHSKKKILSWSIKNLASENSMTSFFCCEYHIYSRSVNISKWPSFHDKLWNRIFLNKFSEKSYAYKVILFLEYLVSREKEKILWLDCIQILVQRFYYKYLNIECMKL